MVRCLAAHPPGVELRRDEVPDPGQVMVGYGFVYTGRIIDPGMIR